MKRINRIVRNGILGTGLAIALSGCAALPVPVQVASWALDGISVLTTRKSLTDHGISIVAEQDCALWRGFMEGAICREEPAPETMMAETSAVEQEVAALMEEPAPQGFEIPKGLSRPELSTLYLQVM